MLPEAPHYGPWAASGEIDILEAVNLGVRCAGCAGGIENRILGTLHFGGAWPGNKHKGSETALAAPLDGWHVFGLVWCKGRLDRTGAGRVYATPAAGERGTSGSNRADARRGGQERVRTCRSRSSAFHLNINCLPI